MSTKKSSPSKKIKKPSTLKGRKKNKEKQSRKTMIIVSIICIIVLTCSIIAAIFIPKILEKNKERELSDSLNSCLSKGYKQKHPDSSDDPASIKRMLFDTSKRVLGGMVSKGAEVEDYTMAISCYNKYHVKDYQERINDLESNKKTAVLSGLTDCVDSAIQNSAVTDEEQNRSKNDSALAFALLTRISAGYQEQINCYEKYDTEESDSKISELRIKKNELDSYIESAKYTPVYVGGGNSSFYCSTNTMGNYTYTSCY